MGDNNYGVEIGRLKYVKKSVNNIPVSSHAATAVQKMYAVFVVEGEPHILEKAQSIHQGYRKVSRYEDVVL